MKGVLFDLFGTLVNYSTSRTEQGYHKTHHLLRRAGVNLPYETFLMEWSSSHAHWDRYTMETGMEHTMRDVADHFMERIAPEQRCSELTHQLWRTYIGEWATGIHYIPGVPEFLEKVSRTYRVGVVSNTHSEELVLDQLERGGIRPFVHHILTSVAHGRPKPHPSIFHNALAGIGCAPHETLFVGDSYAADYEGAINVGMRALLIAPQGHDKAPAGDVISSVLEVERHITIPEAR